MPASLDRFYYERRLFEQGAQLVAGVDEAGRGPLAGPVVAAAVILPREFRHKTLNDSKQLTPAERNEICEELTSNAAVVWAVGVVGHGEIDRYNIVVATHMAMKKAVDGLLRSPDFIIVDGLPVAALGRLRQLALVKGDCRSYSIAAASVIAKVTRDRLMNDYDRKYPEYLFQKHKGYATREHLDALAKHGPCPIHRTSFFPIRARTDEDEFELA